MSLSLRKEKEELTAVTLSRQSKRREKNYAAIECESKTISWDSLTYQPLILELAVDSGGVIRHGLLTGPDVQDLQLKSLLLEKWSWTSRS